MRAAADILRGAGETGVRASVGICTGTVFAGVVGAPAFLQYSVFGDAVNGAAWLMQQSDGGILCDAATRDAAPDHAFAAYGTVTPKGRSEPAPVYSPRGPRPRAQAGGTATFGRDAERARLRAALTRPGGVTAWLHGEPGIGKSHLAQVALGDVTDAGRDPVALRADSIARNLGYDVWQPAFEALLGLSAQMDAAARTRQAASRLRGLPDLDGRLPLAAGLLSLDADESADPAGLSGVRRAERTLAFLADALQQLLGPAPPLILVDDAHWMDTGSWQLLWELRKRLPELKLMLLTRPLDFTALPAEAERLLHAADVLDLPLGDLDPVGSAALVADVLGAAEVPAELTRRIFDRAAGHPYYTRELTAALLQAGVVRIEAGHCHIVTGRGDLAEVAFPENIEAAIATRLSGLSPAAQLTLKVASIEGMTFAPDHLAEVRPGDADAAEIAAHLSAAQAAHLAEPAGAGSARMRFCHALIVETLYNLLLRDQRKQLHARAARAHEDRGAGDDPDLSALLARHWEQAGETDRAIAYLDRAAARAEAAQRHIEAARFLERALALDATRAAPAGPVTTGDWHRRLGNALLEVGAVRRSIPHLADAVGSLAGMPKLRRGTLILRVVIELVKLKIRPMNAPLPEARRRPLLLAGDTCFRLAFQHYELQQILHSVFYTLLMVNLGKRAGGDSAALAQGNANLAMAAFQLPALLDQSRHRRYALEMRDRLADPSCDYWVSFIVGVLQTAAVEPDSARALMQRAIEVAEAKVGPHEWAAAVTSMANLYRPMGRFREAQALDRQVLRSARDRGINLHQMWALHGLCRAQLALGETEKLADTVRRLRALVTDPDNDADSAVSNNLSLLVADAHMAMDAGRVADAAGSATAAARALAGVEEPQIYLEDAPGYVADAVLRCHLAGGVGMARAARDCARAARRLARTYPVARPKAPLTRGDIAYVGGHPRRALRHWQRSAEAARALDLPLMEAHATARMALPGCGTASERETAQARAAAICAERLDLPLPPPWDRLIYG